MVRDYFGGKARHSYWSVHVEAWRQSGLTRRKYCNEHGLNQETFARWLKHLIDEETLQQHKGSIRQERRKLCRQGRTMLSNDSKSKAVQAFWAMHVEAMIWSGMSARSYSMAHHISHNVLLKWVKKIEEGPAWFAAGRYLVWSDIPNNRMLHFDDCDGSVSVFRQPSNNSNGNAVDAEGRLITCEHLSRRITRTEHNGTITVIADTYTGKRFNAPNDVVVKSDGSIWFSDPSYGILFD